jgi:hypothetical protein
MALLLIEAPSHSDASPFAAIESNANFCMQNPVSSCALLLYAGPSHFSNYRPHLTLAHVRSSRKSGKKARTPIKLATHRMLHDLLHAEPHVKWVKPHTR